MNYRFARAAELEPALRLAGHSFPGAGRPPEWWRELIGSPWYGGDFSETVVAGEEGGRLVAMCQLHPMRQWIGGAALPVAGVGAVAVAPTHRKRGIAAGLMTAALRAARDRGDVASILYPFRASFYRRLGYGAAGEVLQYSVAPGALPASDERLRVELLDDAAGRAEALAVYGAWAPSQTGQLDRNARLWDRLCGMPERALVGYRAESGALEGYALAAPRTAPDRFFDVVELVWTTPRSRAGLHGWLASLDDQWQRIVLRALPEHRLGDVLAEARLPAGAAPAWELWEPAATVLTGTMFRILDMRRAWEQRSLATTTSLAVSLDVADAQIPENAGAWTLALHGGRASIERVGTDGEPSGDAAAASLRLDISTLSRLYIGALPATAARAAGLLHCDQPSVLSDLDAALALPQAWTFDRF